MKMARLKTARLKTARLKTARMKATHVKPLSRSLRTLSLTSLLGTSLLVAHLAGCPAGPLPPGDDAGFLGDGFASLVALDAATLKLTLSRDVDATSVTPSAFAVVDYTQVPPVDAAVNTAELAGDGSILIGTSPLRSGRTYTLRVTGLLDASGRPLLGSLNFDAVPTLDTVAVSFVVTDVVTARAWEGLSLLLSVCDDGSFCEQMQKHPLVDDGDSFSVSLDVQVDAQRTLTVVDDLDPRGDHRAYAARLVDDAGRMAGPLRTFVLPDFEAVREVELDVVAPPEVVVPPDPELFPDLPVDTAPNDGVRRVRIVIDDRVAGELVAPALKLSFDSSGSFDASFPATVSMTAMSGEFSGWWEAEVGIAVDPARVADGDSANTFPYFAFLVEGGAEYEGLSLAMVAPDEEPQTLRLLLGEPTWTPVTFRVDVSGAYVTTDGSVRGHFPGEAIFLTGEWQTAVDALGNNCGDAFSGGEQLNLRMRDLGGGLWTRTIWLPPGRPYGWKVVRCIAETGCGPLNQLVASAGRAFATVMKNLVTDNLDAFANDEVGLVDVVAPQSTSAGGQTFDYSSASVFIGSQMGSEPDPSGTPDGQRMFKQEVPDLVVVVGDEAIVTRIFHVGTWRDVNLGQSPVDVVANATPVDLIPYDYDDGFIGRYPPSREAP